LHDNVIMWQSSYTLTFSNIDYMNLGKAVEGLEDREVTIIKYPADIDSQGRMYVGRSYTGVRGLLILVKLEPGDKIPINE